ncbi:Cyclic di-GMP phosphodiesterase Gmr [Tepidimonas alkaliphilus]|uniref:Cyclic di-GMP phosphodiesterase Gmr n=1 Tax=Tepidimonas alkaliphilus TaxID=2588942 RepID=A0A554W971_9BURK|nr:bifunctional diguanylate cyclase/phosphodiesterase [Tepidimonas alkaliphilus]TSE20123.1 Cyclic di-GMP phosphodiesterase Gmr [Tepidimonas alkaliphilus]
MSCHGHWAAITEGLLESVWVVDPTSLQILAVNQAALRLVGAEREVMIGSPVHQWASDLQDHVYWDEWRRGIHQTLESEAWLRRADGELLRVQRRIGPVHPEGDTPVVLVAMQDLTEWQRTRQRLEELLAELRSVLESSSEGILVCDLDGHVRAFNRAFAHIWALPQTLLTQPDEPALLRHLAALVHDPSAFQSRLSELQRAPLMEAHDLVLLRDGRLLERSSRPQLARGRPIGRIHVYRDVTERAATEAKLRLAAKVFEASLDAIVITDAQHHIVACNPAALRLVGLEHDDPIGRSIDDVLQACPERPGGLHEAKAALLERGLWEGELWLPRPHGPALALQVSWVLLRDAQGEPLNTVLFAKDLSEKLEAQRRIEQLAYSDPLTGLPNRLMLGERVGHAIRLAQQSGHGFAVLFLDLDRFKGINDSLGHAFGDRVLVEIADRLRRCLRQTDTLARLGGDEFVIHLHDADRAAAERAAQRIAETVAQPIALDQLEFSLSCSIGIALYPHDATTLDGLIQCADTAMYQVKERGKGHWRFYEPGMNADLLARLQTDHAMRQSLQRGEFELFYQPRVDLRRARVSACEALLRWHRPGTGLVLPGAFIGVAEETGLIVQLGQWVLDRAVAQARAWLDAGHPMQVAVNVSALQFERPTFVQEVADTLQRHGLPGRLLELELTETILVRDANEALTRLQALAALGVELSLDDFGTGYSSLTYLRRFPLHRLKIDRSFVVALDEPNPTDEAIVAAIVRMGHALGMQVVAEGVEQPAQLERLCRLGCDHFQGFLYAQPMPVADVTAHLEATVPWRAESSA